MSKPKTKPTVIGRVACEYLEKYPYLPTKSMAYVLLENEPAVFTDLEQARNAVRRYRGNQGAYQRQHCQGPRQHRRKNGRPSDGVIPLPEPLEEPDSWRIVPVEFKRGLVLCDAHIPYHDRTAVETAVAYGRQLKPDCVVLNGDIMDFYTVSHWERDPRQRQPLNHEVETGRAFLEYLRDQFGTACRIIYKEGNHEERLWRHAWKRCPEFFTVLGPNGQPMLRLDALLDFEEYGVELVDNKQPIRCGPHLHLLHGHEWPQSFTNPVNPARGLFLKAQCNCAAGHLHQTSNHTESGLAKTVSTFGLGCLCHLRPKYRPLNKWNHGFGMVELDGDTWSMDNLKIIRGKVV